MYAGHQCPNHRTPVSAKQEKEQDVINKTKKGASSKKRTKAEDVPIPPKLDSPEFQAAWLEWLAYRRERKLTLTARTVNAQLEKLAGWGTSAAIESINASIANGWQGLFDQRKGNGNGRSRNQVRQDSPARIR